MTTSPSSNPSTPSANDPAVPPPPLRKVSLRLLAAGAIFLIGLILLIVPLICIAFELDIVQSVSAIFVLLAIVCCLSGVGIAVSEVITVEATTKTTLELFGRKVPIALRGQIVVVIIFLSIGVSVVLLTNLHHRFDHYEDYLLLKRNHVNLEKEKDQIARTAHLLEHVLSGAHTEELHILKLSVMCGDESHEYMSAWHRVYMKNGKRKVDHFDSTEAPLPVAQESRTYRFGKAPLTKGFLTVTVELEKRGVLTGQLKIADAKQLHTTCTDYLKKLAGPIHPTGGELADGPSKIHE